MSDVFHKKTGVKQEYWSVFAEVITPDLDDYMFPGVWENYNLL